ncbi:MAG: hypothetical protein AAF685_08280 [Cyanobacteria bacterium P01_C01_bin.89]
MKPKLKDMDAWYKAEALMQPALIRAIDNIRKALDQCDWQGKYEEEWAWPEGTTEETKTRIKLLEQQLKDAEKVGDMETVDEVQGALNAQPQPQPLYTFHLKKGDRTAMIDLWQICYRICFQDYAARAALSTGDRVSVDVDESLFETGGDIDWQRLDEKAKTEITTFFKQLSED